MKVVITPEQTQRFNKDVDMLAQFISHAIDTHIAVEKLDPLVYTGALICLIKESMECVPKKDRIFVYNSVNATINLMFELLSNEALK